MCMETSVARTTTLQCSLLFTCVASTPFPAACKETVKNVAVCRRVEEYDEAGRCCLPPPCAALRVREIGLWIHVEPWWLGGHGERGNTQLTLLPPPPLLPVGISFGRCTSRGQTACIATSSDRLSRTTTRTTLEEAKGHS